MKRITDLPGVSSLPEGMLPDSIYTDSNNLYITFEYSYVQVVYPNSSTLGFDLGLFANATKRTLNRFTCSSFNIEKGYLYKIVYGTDSSSTTTMYASLTNCADFDDEIFFELDYQIHGFETQAEYNNQRLKLIELSQKESGLPKLYGSIKQIEWALKLRSEFLNEPAPQSFKDFATQYETEAKWWIENRKDLITATDLRMDEFNKKQIRQTASDLAKAIGNTQPLKPKKERMQLFETEYLEPLLSKGGEYKNDILNIDGMKYYPKSDKLQNGQWTNNGLEILKKIYL